MLVSISGNFIIWFESYWVELQEGDFFTFHQVWNLKQVFDFGSEGIPLCFGVFKLWSEHSFNPVDLVKNDIILFFNLIGLFLDLLDQLRNFLFLFFYYCVFFAYIRVYIKFKVNDNVMREGIGIPTISISLSFVMKWSIMASLVTVVSYNASLISRIIFAKACIESSSVWFVSVNSLIFTSRGSLDVKSSTLSCFFVSWDVPMFYFLDIFI